MSTSGPDFPAGFVAPVLANNTDIGRTIARLLKLPIANLLLVGSTGLDAQVPAIWNVGHGEGRWWSIPGPMPVGCRTTYGRCSPVLSATELSGRRTVSWLCRACSDAQADSSCRLATSRDDAAQSARGHTCRRSGEYSGSWFCPTSRISGQRAAVAFAWASVVAFAVTGNR